MKTSIAKEIIDLKNNDLKLRNQLIKNGKLYNGYNEEMEMLHISNAVKLSRIIDEIGYPTINIVGKDASDAAWLIIQHSISQPKFMKKCAKLLSNAVDEEQASAINLAYLTDRIAVFEGKDQLYGTQFDWDENKYLSPNKYDNINQVNQRRKAIGLNSLEEQIEVMRKRAESENETAPTNLKQRKKEYNEWRKKVGWTKNCT